MVVELCVHMGVYVVIVALCGVQFAERWWRSARAATTKPEAASIPVVVRT